MGKKTPERIGVVGGSLRRQRRGIGQGHTFAERPAVGLSRRTKQRCGMAGAENPHASGYELPLRYSAGTGGRPCGSDARRTMRGAVARTGPTGTARLPLRLRPDCQGGAGHVAGGSSTGRGRSTAIARTAILGGATLHALAVATAVSLLLGCGPSAGHARTGAVLGSARRLHGIVGRDMRSGLAGTLRSDGSRGTDDPGELEVAIGERGGRTPVPARGGCGRRASRSGASRHGGRCETSTCSA